MNSAVSSLLVVVYQKLCQLISAVSKSDRPILASFNFKKLQFKTATALLHLIIL